MPKHTAISLRQRRALNQLQIKGNTPRAALLLSPGEWIRAMRWALRMTQAQLARRAGVSQQHVALIEAGRVDPKVGTLRTLLRSLYCDLALLPVPTRRPGDIVAEKTAQRGWEQTSSRIWD
jgi:transcriptional regulator with XRE-family HTH domain